MGKKTYDSSTISAFPSEFKMELPDGYRIDTTYDDDFNEAYHLRGGFYINDEGEEDFSFTCSFITLNCSVNDRDNMVREGKLKANFVPGMMLEQVADSFMEAQEQQFGPGTRLNLYNSYPASTIMKFYKPFMIFGATLDTYVLFYWVEVKEDLMFGFNTVYQDNSSDIGEFYKHLLNAIKSVRVSGKPVDIGKLTPKKLEQALDMEKDENVEALDLGLQIGISFTDGEKETKYTINNDGSVTDETTNTVLEYTTPDETLYPHYNSKLQTQGLGGMLGVKVVVNQSGTEYQFYNLKEDLGDDAAEGMREAVNKLSDKGASSYSLAKKAEQMRKVFRVSNDIFDTAHDRECELVQGMMHRAYHMSALRSFAWTMAKHCDDVKTEPGKLNLDQIHRIIDFAANNDWLNYDDKSYCKSLCGTQDLHVYYLPDNTSQSIKKVFEPSKETIEETKRIQEKIPTYNPILEQVGSLDGLRNDLEYIYPAVELVYEDLKNNRNINEPLEGNYADIVYAWCALAYAARGPFFSEDGPMTCFFTQETTPVEFGKKNTQNEDFSGWGDNITVNGAGEETYDASGWGDNITVNGASAGGETYNASGWGDNITVDGASADDEGDDAWGSGITVGGKRV